MKLYLAILVLLLRLVGSLSAQDNLCACCTHHSLLDNEKYERLFPPQSIRQKRLSDIIFYTSGRRSRAGEADSLENEHKEIQFKFDKNGYINEVISYDKEGMPIL